MDHIATIEKIAEALGLGALESRPRRVSGGYLHRMYRLQTAAGDYALKLLNPAIMQRKDAQENYRRAERLEQVLSQNKIPIVPAMEFSGHKMQCIDGQHFYLFPWVEGKALDWKEITAAHCQIVGELLAQIHKIDLRREPSGMEECHVDWNSYLSMAEQQCPEISKELQAAVQTLYLGQEAYNDAVHRLPPVRCISDGDMDSKNVLWSEGMPLIIDLECLDYGNPFAEMFQLALSWSGDVICRLDYGCLRAFLASYQQEFGPLEGNPEDLYGMGFHWLFWLEYNLKRALRIECANEEERQLGISEARATLGRICYYASIRDKILKQLQGISCKTP